MPSLSKEAALVHEALVARGLETPLRPPVHEMDNETRKSLIAGHMTEIMQLLNLDLADDSLMETPHRIAKMYVDEIFSGLDYANFPKITLIENKMKVDEMVTVRDITLTSTCEHHFVTIDGKATVAYIPKDSVIGLSKINRIVQFFAQRPQVQERLTQQILIALQTLLGTNNVAVSDRRGALLREGAWHPRCNQCHDNDLSWWIVQIQSEYAPRVSARCAPSQLIKRQEPWSATSRSILFAASPFWGSCY